MHLRSLSALLACLALSGTASQAAATAPGDLRGGVSVGMDAASLPAAGYKDFACAGPGGQRLDGWTQWSACPADSDGLRAIHVAVDEPGQEDTLVAGHPVNLTLSFDGRGRLARIVIDTKGDARLFLRKKAYLLGLQARARYGDDGWLCRNEPLAGDEEAIGDVAIKEHCVKTVGDRRLTVDRSLYRKTGSDPKTFTNESHVAIVWIGKDP